MSRLGCARSYVVELRTRGGRAKVAVFGQGVTGVQWSRVLTGVSEAAVTVVPRSRACARDLNRATGWAHELCVWRDGERVWEGPLIDKDDTGNEVVLTARDLSAWWAKRIVHQGYRTMGDPVDVTRIAEAVLVDAFTPDDPDAIKGIERVPTGILTEREVAGESVMADADIADLVQLGMDWTVVGRRTLLFGGRAPLGRIPALSRRHFTGNLPVTEAGAGVTTRVVVQGGGVRAVAGGVHEGLGLLERIVTAGTVGTLRDAAAAALGALHTPSLMLAGDASLALTAAAPVAVGQLVPGVVARVSGRGAAVEVSTDATLSKVAAEWAAGGEKIGVTFVETGDRTEGGVDGG